jgi:hypothetical protein
MPKQVLYPDEVIDVAQGIIDGLADGGDPRDAINAMAIASASFIAGSLMEASRFTTDTYDEAIGKFVTSIFRAQEHILASQELGAYSNGQEAHI